MPADRLHAADPAATHCFLCRQLGAGSRERDNSIWIASRFLPPPPPNLSIVFQVLHTFLKSKHLPSPIKLVVCRQIASRPERKLAGEELGACAGLQDRWVSTGFVQTAQKEADSALPLARKASTQGCTCSEGLPKSRDALSLGRASSW